MLSIHVSDFGAFNGALVKLYKLSNNSMDVSIMNYGCTIVSIETPDRFGKKKNIVAGFNSFESYLSNHPYFGCVVGRFANRIRNGKFSIDDKAYQVTLNNGHHHLHGGTSGFNQKLWNIEAIIDEEKQVGVRFSYISVDGEEGFPGNLSTYVTYLLNEENELIIQYHAATDQPTIINLTNHSYFNLTGFDDATIFEHELQVYADRFTVKDEDSIPTGEILPVKNTLLDFTSLKKIGEHIHLITDDKGYDHNYVLNDYGKGIIPAAVLYEPEEGRAIKVFTDLPGLQIYTSNWWDGSITGAQNHPYIQYGAVTLETQAFPDAPNHSEFPSVILRPGEEYTSTTVFQFSKK